MSENRNPTIVIGTMNNDRNDGISIILLKMINDSDIFFIN